LATPNYGYEKRQRELAKKKKKEEKLKAKANRQHQDPNAPEGADAGVQEGADDASTGGDGASD
jgi:hypothetical protein